jgi:hypothetical protein
LLIPVFTEVALGANRKASMHSHEGVVEIIIEHGVVYEVAGKV